MHASSDTSTAETWITRCPECNTAFRIARQHLLAAQGSVRCGSCLQVFKAYKHIVGAPLPEELLPAASAPESAATEQAKTREDTSTAAPTSSPSAEAHQGLDLSADALSPEQEPFSPAFTPADEAFQESDEAWAMSLVDDLNSENAAPDTDTNIDTETETETDTYSEADSSTKALSESSATASSNQQLEQFDYLDQLSQDPINLTYQQRPRSMLKRMAMPAAIVIALLLLAGQFLWNNLTELSGIDSIRPVTVALCQLISCPGSARHNSAAIQSGHIVVRKDAEYANALVVDAIITNTAAFDQPYPRLRMSFISAENTLIASRVFTPDQYLSGEAAGAQLMDAEQPVHLALKVISPGQDIATVTLDVLP